MEELAEGEVAEFFVDGGAVAVARVEGAHHAVSNACPHAGGPIGDGDIVNGAVRCPLHGWSFDLTTGRCAVDPSLALKVYRCRVRNGRVEVEIPPEVASNAR